MKHVGELLDNFIYFFLKVVLGGSGDLFLEVLISVTGSCKSGRENDDPSCIETGGLLLRDKDRELSL
jgi:hypothetical protein